MPLAQEFGPSYAVCCAGMQCHHIVVEDWSQTEERQRTLFVSIPSVLDPSLCPEGTHLVHMFTPDWMNEWQVSPGVLCDFVLWLLQIVKF